ncbi:MAG: hypothetical protein PHG02_07740 [Oscillospiraceae bacterium]|nr:hypothetical protein [Oscillospiraceae bacterium]
MDVLILSTSPRKSFSTSLYFSKILKLFLAGHNVEIILLRSAFDYNRAIRQLDKIDVLVFATPVYVDSVPSTTLEYLEKMEQYITAKKYKFSVYTIANCGFYEGNQCRLALKTYELWCERADVKFLGGVGIGSGVMLGFVRILPLIGLAITAIQLMIQAVVLCFENTFSFPLLFAGFFPANFVIQTALWILFTLGAFVHIFNLRTSIIKKRNHVCQYTTAWFCPRCLFVCMASLYWFFRALFIHGVMPWTLFRKDKEYVDSLCK